MTGPAASRPPAARRLLLAAPAPALFFLVAATPVELLGCRLRGLLAFGIALSGALGGVAAAVLALRARLRGEPGSELWILTALVLAVPAAALLVLA